MRLSKRNGFTLVETLIGLVIGGILLVAIGTIMVFMVDGIAESEDFGTATNRVDIIRQLTFDGRTGDRLIFPATNGATGAWTSGSFTGHQVRFRAMEYDPDTGTSRGRFINWESRRAVGAPSTTPFQVYRFVMEDANGDGLENDGGYTQSFVEGNIERFLVQRTARNNFNVEMETTQNTETAHVQLAVTLRNVQ